MHHAHQIPIPFKNNGWWIAELHAPTIDLSPFLSDLPTLSLIGEMWWFSAHEKKPKYTKRYRLALIWEIRMRRSWRSWALSRTIAHISYFEYNLFLLPRSPSARTRSTCAASVRHQFSPFSSIQWILRIKPIAHFIVWAFARNVFSEHMGIREPQKEREREREWERMNKRSKESKQSISTTLVPICSSNHTEQPFSAEHITSLQWSERGKL